MKMSHRGMLALLAVFLLAGGASCELTSHFGASNGFSKAGSSTTFSADYDDEVMSTATAGFGPGGVILTKGLFTYGDQDLEDERIVIDGGSTASSYFDVLNASSIAHSWVADTSIPGDNIASIGEYLDVANAQNIEAGASATNGVSTSTVDLRIVNGTLADYSNWAWASPTRTYAKQAADYAEGERVYFKGANSSRPGVFSFVGLEILDGSIENYAAETESDNGIVSSSQDIGGAVVWTDPSGYLHVDPYDDAEGTRIMAGGYAVNSEGQLAGVRTIVANGTLNNYEGAVNAGADGASAWQEIGSDYLIDKGASGEYIRIESIANRTTTYQTSAAIEIEDGSIDRHDLRAASNDAGAFTNQSLGGDSAWTDTGGSHHIRYSGAEGENLSAWSVAMGEQKPGSDNQTWSEVDIHDGSLDRYESGGRSKESHLSTSQSIGGYNDYGKFEGAVSDDGEIDIYNGAYISGDKLQYPDLGVWVDNGSVDYYQGYAGADIDNFSTDISQSLGGITTSGVTYDGAEGDEVAAWLDGYLDDGSEDLDVEGEVYVEDGSLDRYTASLKEEDWEIDAAQTIDGLGDYDGAVGEYVDSYIWGEDDDYEGWVEIEVNGTEATDGEIETYSGEGIFKADDFSIRQYVNVASGQNISASTNASNGLGDISTADVTVVNGALTDYSSGAEVTSTGTGANQSAEVAGGERVYFVGANSTNSSEAFSFVGLEILEGVVSDYSAETSSRDGTVASNQSIGLEGSAGGSRITAGGFASDSQDHVAGVNTTILSGVLWNYEGAAGADAGNASVTQKIGSDFIVNSGAAGSVILIESTANETDSYQSSTGTRIDNGIIDRHLLYAESNGTGAFTNQSIGGDRFWTDAGGDQHIRYNGAMGSHIDAWSESFDGQDPDASNGTWSYVEVYGGRLDRYASEGMSNQSHLYTSQEIGGSDEDYGEFIGAQSNSWIDISNGANISGGDETQEAESGLWIYEGSVDYYKGYAGADIDNFSTETSQSIGGINADDEAYDGAEGWDVKAWIEGDLEDDSDELEVYGGVDLEEGYLDRYTGYLGIEDGEVHANQSIDGSWRYDGAEADHIDAYLWGESDNYEGEVGICVDDGDNEDAEVINYTSEGSFSFDEASISQESYRSLIAASPGYPKYFDLGMLFPAIWGGEINIYSSIESDGSESEAETHVEGDGYAGIRTSVDLEETPDGILMVADQNITALGDGEVRSSSHAQSDDGMEASQEMTIEKGGVIGYTTRTAVGPGGSSSRASASQEAKLFGGESSRFGWTGENPSGDYATGSFKVMDRSITDPEEVFGRLDEHGEYFNDLIVEDRLIRGSMEANASGYDITASMVGRDQKKDQVADSLDVDGGAMYYEGDLEVRPSYSLIDSTWEAEGDRITKYSKATDKKGDFAKTYFDASDGSASGESWLKAKTTSAEATADVDFEGDYANFEWYADNMQGDAVYGQVKITDGLLGAYNYALATGSGVEGNGNIIDAEAERIYQGWNADSRKGYRAWGSTIAWDGYLKGSSSAKASYQSAEASETVDADVRSIKSSNEARVSAKGWSSKVNLMNQNVQALDADVYADFTHSVKATGSMTTASQTVRDAEGSLDIGGYAKSGGMNAWYGVDLIDATELISSAKFTANGGAHADAGWFKATGDKVNRGLGASTRNVATVWAYTNMTGGSLSSKAFSASALSNSAQTSGSWSAKAKTTEKNSYAKAALIPQPARLIKKYSGTVASSSSAAATRWTRKVS